MPPLQPLLKELIDDLTPVAEDRRLSLVLEEEPVQPVLGDAERLKQVFINLLTTRCGTRIPEDAWRYA